jgi:hypothetical protein
MSAAIFEKSHYDNENQLFCRKIEISKPQKGSAVVVMLHEGAKVYVEKGRQLEKYS